MTKTKSTKRALLLSALSLLMCVSMLIGSTFAWFTDSVISGNNKIVAGNLDIELEYYNGTEWKTVNGATNLFDETLWEPGHTDVVYLRLKNIGSLALKYELAINIVSETPGINMAGDEFLLSDYIYMGVVENIDGQSNPYSKDAAGRAKAVAEATNATIISEGYAVDGEMAKGANDLYMAVVVYMPSTVDNDANYRGNTAPSINLGINLISTQLDSESDSFGNDYDKDAMYSISAGEKVILNGNKFDNAVENHGEATLNNIEINANGGNALYNEGAAELKNATLNMTGSTGYITNSRTDGSVTIYENVTATSSGGGVNVWQGKAVFKSGTITTNSTSTSARHMFYVADGAELVIEDGEFFFNPTNLTRKGSYICAQANAKVIVNGGTFHKPSTRTAPIQEIDGATVEIRGGSFEFDPTTWVADGYKVVKNGNTWHVVAENVTAAATLDDVKTAFATGGEVVLIDDIKFDKITAIESGKEVHLDLNGQTITVDENTTSNTLIWVKDGAKLTVDGNGTIDMGSVSTMAIFCPYGELVIENGTFIRDKVTTVTNATTGLFMGAKSGDCNVTINGGYFDPGYYDVNAANIEDILAGTAEFTETADDIAKRGKPGDANLVRVAVKDNVSVVLNHSGYGSFKVYGGTFVGANPAWGDEGCMLPTTPNYLRPWSYYQGALLDGQTFNENGIVLPDGYTITKGTTADSIPTYTVEYNK